MARVLALSRAAFLELGLEFELETTWRGREGLEFTGRGAEEEETARRRLRRGGGGEDIPVICAPMSCF